MCSGRDACARRRLGQAARGPLAQFYFCGLEATEEGVVLALRDIAAGAGLDWAQVGATLEREGRLHLETQ
jgi:benzoyl-CoA 2,3-dioxygenase component A